MGLYVDLHGHSSKPGVFVYGVEAKQWREWYAGHPKNPPPPHSELIFPSLLQERCNLFDLEACEYKLRPSKYGTGRAVFWRHFGIEHSFTIECSFGGAARGPCAGLHFDVHHLRNIGRDMCLAVWDMLGDEQEQNSKRILAAGQVLSLLAFLVTKSTNPDT